jgi:hypothetical protein
MPDTDPLWALTILIGNSVLYHSALYSLATKSIVKQSTKKKKRERREYNAEENIWTSENGINGRKRTSE